MSAANGPEARTQRQRRMGQLNATGDASRVGSHAGTTPLACWHLGSSHSLTCLGYGKGEDIYKQHTHARVCRMMPTHACAAGPTPRYPAHLIPTSHAQRDHTTADTRNRDTLQNDTQNTQQRCGRAGHANSAGADPSALPTHMAERGEVGRWKFYLLPTTRCAVRM